MKSKNVIPFIILFLLFGFSAHAQDTTNIKFSLNADFASRYIWRGFDFGNAPSVQPTLEASYKNFAIGAWGSQSISSNTGGLEADLYTTYSFNFGLSIGVSDYYFPEEKLRIMKDLPDTASFLILPERNGNYFDFENAHFLEANINYEIKNFSLSANYMFHNAADDIYAEIGYNYKNLTVFIGGGNESYTNNGKFNICNTGFTITKEIKLSDKFDLPVFGSFILNPDSEQVHMLFGISL